MAHHARRRGQPVQRGDDAVTTGAPGAPQEPVMTFGHETFWEGFPDGHLRVSLRVGTVFGLTNEAAIALSLEQFANTPELCQSMVEEARGDILAVFHVKPTDWVDYAHALYRRIFMIVAQRPELWNKRTTHAALTYNEAQATGITTSNRIN
jgi:hypothetical protein